MKDVSEVLEIALGLIDDFVSERESGETFSEQMSFPLPGIESVKPVEKLTLTAYEMAQSGKFTTYSVKIERPGTYGSVLRVTLTEYDEK